MPRAAIDQSGGDCLETPDHFDRMAERSTESLKWSMLREANHDIELMPPEAATPTSAWIAIERAAVGKSLSGSRRALSRASSEAWRATRSPRGWRLRADPRPRRHDRASHRSTAQPPVRPSAPSALRIASAALAARSRRSPASRRQNRLHHVGKTLDLHLGLRDQPLKRPLAAGVAAVVQRADLARTERFDIA